MLVAPSCGEILTIHSGRGNYLPYLTYILRHLTRIVLSNKCQKVILTMVCNGNWIMIFLNHDAQIQFTHKGYHNRQFLPQFPQNYTILGVKSLKHNHWGCQKLLNVFVCYTDPYWACYVCPLPNKPQSMMLCFHLVVINDAAIMMHICVTEWKP